jgi:restriction system protein
MTKSGVSAQWERQLAAERREAKRRARERARWEKEEDKARKQRHLESQQRAAETKTAMIERQIKILDEIMSSILPLKPPTAS